MNPISKSKESVLDQLTEGSQPYYDHFLHLNKDIKPHQILWAEESPKDRAILEQARRRHYGEKDIDIQIK